MFAIVISEKGGGERREVFDKAEIDVGRVQGNDLMLPKGNVSKHHARLLFRDGRFIVTDLKSTNGTYVNGRKISQATIVREGDKIYIGDFVLRIDAGAAQADDAGQQDEGARTLARTGPRDAGGPSAQPPAPVHAPSVDPQPAQRTSTRVPGPPRVPTGAQPPMGSQAPRYSAPPLPATQSTSGPPGGAPSAAPGASQPSAPRGSSSRGLPRESPAQAARRLALVTLMDRVAELVDIARLDHDPSVASADRASIERTVIDQAAAMQGEGELPSGATLDDVKGDALAELVGAGAFDRLLDDDDVTEIHVARHDQVVVVRAGSMALSEVSFTSERALMRAVARLAARSGRALEAGDVRIVRRLSRSALMIAVLPPDAAQCAVTIRKRRRLDMSLEDFVRLGGMSRPMATFLEACVHARANVLVCGARPTTAALLAAALAASSTPGDRVCAVQELDEILIPQASLVTLPIVDGDDDVAARVRMASRLRPDRLVVGPIGHASVAAALTAIADGAMGVVATIGSPSLRQALARAVSQLLLSQPGLSVDAARECVGESFDFAVEIVALDDGRPRIVRVAELGATDAKGVVARDVFTASSELGDATFSATGVVPRLVGELAQRGVRIDPNLFKRSVGRG